MIAIVTDVHYRMSLALIRDLAQAGVRVVCCEREGAGVPLGFRSRWAAQKVTLPREDWPDELYRLCAQVCEERRERPALLPVGAATLAALAEDRERFSAVCGLCIPAPEQLELFNSKVRVHELAASLGVPVPGSFVRSPGEEADAFLSRIPLPAVVKPVCGERLGLAAAQRYAIVRTGGQLREAFLRFQALAGEDPVVQEYLPGGALGCSVLALEGRVLSHICHRRLREYPVSGGPSSCCRCVDRPDLAGYAAKLTEAAGYTGLAMFEFKEDAGGKPRLLEVNPRIWGTYPLTRTADSGLSLLWCTLARNRGNPEKEPLPLPRADKPRACKMVFAPSDWMAALGYLRQGRPGQALGALADLLNPFVRDGLFEWGDVAPALAYYRSLLGKERRP